MDNSESRYDIVIAIGSVTFAILSVLFLFSVKDSCLKNGANLIGVDKDFNLTESNTQCYSENDCLETICEIELICLEVVKSDDGKKIDFMYVGPIVFFLIVAFIGFVLWGSKKKALFVFGLLKGCIIFMAWIKIDVIQYIVFFFVLIFETLYSGFYLVKFIQEEL